MMKIVLGAIALAFAVPAVAQTAPATDPHAQHQAMDHSQMDHSQMDHSQHAGAKHDCKECCEKMKGKDGKMECMDKKGEAKRAASGASAHEGHAH